MKYLIALLCPPLALLLVGKPIQAVLSLLWCGVCVLGGAAFLLPLLGLFFPVLHALLVVGQANAQQRQDELLSTLTGKPVQRANQEARIFTVGTVSAAVVVLALLAAGSVGAIYLPQKLAQVQRQQDLHPVAALAAVPELLGQSMAQVVSSHGEPWHKDAATGIAQWQRFQARFEGGVVTEVKGRH